MGYAQHDRPFAWKLRRAARHHQEVFGAFPVAAAVPDGEAVSAAPENGYITLERNWNAGDRLDLTLDMPVEVVRANPAVTADAGRIALMRGPLVYALESTDNGRVLSRLLIDTEAGFTTAPAPNLPDGVLAIRGEARLESDASEGRLYYRAAPQLEKAGFTVYDVNQTADQTILEEGTEFIKKVRYWCLGERSPEVNMMAHHPLPHFTSCCPGWVRNMEINFASAIPHVSTTKSPIQMGGALGKTWAAKHVWNKDPRDVCIVSITPCTAKIFEASRPEFIDAWKWNVEHNVIPKDSPVFPDIDYSLTTRDIAEVFRRLGNDPLKMPTTHEVKPTEKYTGAGTIFGCSGGVMEAALRTAYALLAGEELKNPDIISVRGLNNSLVEATVPIPLKAQGGKIFELRVAVVNGALQDLKNVMKIINEDKDRWHFIEVMNCPGGCVNGGGQPLQGAGSSWLAPTTPLPVKL